MSSALLRSLTISFKVGMTWHSLAIVLFGSLVSTHSQISYSPFLGGVTIGNIHGVGWSSTFSMIPASTSRFISALLCYILVDGRGFFCVVLCLYAVWLSNSLVFLCHWTNKSWYSAEGLVTLLSLFIHCANPRSDAIRIRKGSVGPFYQMKLANIMLCFCFHMDSQGSVSLQWITSSTWN